MNNRSKWDPHKFKFLKDFAFNFLNCILNDHRIKRNKRRYLIYYTFDLNNVPKMKYRLYADMKYSLKYKYLI